MTPLRLRGIVVFCGAALVAMMEGCAPTSGTSRSGSGSSGGSPGGGSSGGVSGVAATGGAPSGGGGVGSGGSGSDGSGSGGSGSGGSTPRGTGGNAGSAATGDASTDVAMADAGTSDAPSREAGDLAPGGCIGLFCEDFESGSIDPNVWNVKTSGGQTVVVQKVNVAHGSYAAQFHAQPNILSYDLIITKAAPVALRGHHFGRAYFFVAPQPPPAHALFLFAGSSGFPKLKYLEVAGINATWQLTSVDLAGVDANAAALPGTTEAYSSGGTIPLGRWICLEWEFNDAPDQIRVFVNGPQDFAFTNILLNNVSAAQVGGFTNFGFGYYAWHPATYAFDVYYDDIVLDTKRVGCLP